MYKISLEGDDTVIRIKRDLMNEEMVNRLLDLIHLSAVLEKSRFAEAREKILARMVGLPTGFALLRDPALNKDAAFSEEEREVLGLRGLLPARLQTMEEQVERTLENFRKKDNDLEKYLFMIALQDRNKTLFYRVVIDHLDEMMPIIYTPTVGQACLEYGHIFRRPRGIFISLKDRGRMADLLRNWPFRDIRIIVVTDGERILGLGDLGADGMGIPVGKLALYSACAGIHPSQSLPVTLDVGTENESLLNDPLYIGLRQRRLRGAAYDDFVEEFIVAVAEVFPRTLIQFEDFGNINAFRLLERYRERICTFNDDIQGTAAVALAGLNSALCLKGGKLAEQKFLIVGAGEAGQGIAGLAVAAMMEEGLSLQEARQNVWFVDSHGLVVKSRSDLTGKKLLYAHDHESIWDLLAIVETLQPTVIIGVSGKQGLFTKSLLEAMGKNHERPIIFPLSNPTSKAECTAEEAYQATAGRAIVATGSPFAPVTVDGRTLVPSQGNNVYIFPGVGLGVIASGARHVTDEMFFAAAKTLSHAVAPEDLEQGRVYPPLARIREVSAAIAATVAEVAYQQELATKPKPEDLLAAIKSHMYEPQYQDYVKPNN
jgi:malate dehydrogenase (oxaloacetate-decarboxylating)(NADP+)